MPKFDFRRWDNDVLIASEEAETVKEALENLVRRDVDLYRASLVGASLVGARLDGIKHDLWAILFRTPNEVEGLALALKEGRVDGSAYEGECACLVGTIANIRNCKFSDIPGVIPNSSRPAETWFLGIKRGDTPDTNSISKLTIGWIEEFQTLMAIAKQ